MEDLYRFCVDVCLISNRSQMSKCGKNKKVVHEVVGMYHKCSLKKNQSKRMHNTANHIISSKTKVMMMLLIKIKIEEEM